jgi:hypothetical protein
MSNYYQVTQIINGIANVTLLPKEQAERLYRQIRTRGSNANITKVKVQKDS